MLRNSHQILARLVTVLALLAVVLTLTPSVAQAQAPTCFGREATIVGTAGPDTLTGSFGPDVIVSLGGDDTIHALGGDDYVCSGAGNDTVHAGNGNDWVDADDNNDQRGNDDVFGGNGDDFLRGYSGVDDLRGGAGNDDLQLIGFGSEARGGIGDDRFRGSNALMFGNAGNDRFDLNHGARVFAGPGDDYVSLDFSYGTIPNVVYLGAGNDEAWDTSDLPNRIFGQGGNDELAAWIYARPAARLFNGGPGHDWLRGGAGDDQLKGGPGNDLIEGNQGGDLIRGGEGNDILIGDSYLGQGTDRILGLDGNDTCADQGRVRTDLHPPVFTVTMDPAQQTDPFVCENTIDPTVVYDLPDV